MIIKQLMWVKIFLALLKEEPYHQLMVGGILVVIIAFTGTFGYWLFGLYYLQDWGIVDCAYMTLISLSTVGFGEILKLDNLPVVRVFTMVLILSGMGVLVFFASTLTAFIVEGQLRHLISRRRMLRMIDDMKNHVIICGAGETGYHIVEELHTTNRPCVVIDLNEEACKKIHEKIGYVPYIIGDATDDEVLEVAGINRAEGIFAALDNDKDNLVITITARLKQPKIRIISKAVGITFGQKLLRSGASSVVTSNRIGAMRMVSEMVRPAVTSFLDEMLREKDRPMRIEEVRVEEGSPMQNKSLGQLDIRKRLALSVISLHYSGTGCYNYSPDPAEPLQPGTVLICLGEVAAIEQLRREVAPAT